MVIELIVFSFNEMKHAITMSIMFNQLKQIIFAQ